MKKFYHQFMKEVFSLPPYTHTHGALYSEETSESAPPLYSSFKAGGKQLKADS
jgi:hypothetical protein